MRTRIVSVHRRWQRAFTGLLAAGLLWSPATASADPVLDWNAIAATAVLNAAPNHPFNQARVMAITQLAVFEAVNSITGEYEPYLATPIAAAPGASLDAAVAAAAHRALVEYITDPATIAMLNTARQDAFDAIPDGQSKQDGIELGKKTAMAMIALRVNDGSAPAAFHVPGSTLPGVWQPTPSCTPAPANGRGTLLQWQNVKPFGITGATDYLLPAPPSLTSNEYKKDFLEVQTMGRADSTERSEERSLNARLWVPTSPTYGLSMATRQIATDKGLSVSENARALALIMMGINDALIASFYNKYYYELWRPETAIQAVDPGFKPFIVTPCFPSYPSNHASGTNGGLEVMRRLFGAAGHDITISNMVPALGSLPATTVTHHYTQLKQIADDVDDGRVLGGIHWRFDQIGGNVLGRDVGTYIVKNHLQPVHGH